MCLMKLLTMKRRTFFTLLYISLMICFFNGLFIPITGGVVAAIGSAIILLTTIMLERLVMYITSLQRKN